MLPGFALGGSLDYEIRTADKGRGVLEIKTADWLVAKRWVYGPPLAYELQIQAYLALTGWSWGVMAVLVGGNDLRLFEYERRAKTIDLILNKVSEFWRSIEDNTPPKPDFSKDHEAISTLYGTAEAGKVVDLSSSNRLPELIEEYQSQAEHKRESERRTKAAKAELLTLIGDSEIATCGDYRIKAGLVNGTQDREITQADVGSVIKGRSSYRSLYISTRTQESTNV